MHRSSSIGSLDFGRQPVADRLMQLGDVYCAEIPGPRPPRILRPFTVFAQLTSAAANDIVREMHALTVVATQPKWSATTSHTATWRQNANSAPTKLFARRMPQQFPVWNGGTQPSSRTLCARYPTNFVVGNWVWLHNSASTVRQGAKAGTDAKVLETKFRARLDGPLQDPCRRPLPLPL